MKVLITGGAGFLGAWIARRLIAQGCAVRIFDRSADRRLVEAIAGAAAGAIEFVTGDVTEARQVLAACEGCGAAAHLAALLTPACQADPLRGAQVNLLGTLNLFEAARALKLGGVVYASSAGVFGPNDGLHPQPTTLYGAYKLACEGVGRAYAMDHGLASVGFRPLVVYGPGREVGSTAGVTLACRAALEGRPYTIPFTGATDLIYVDDVAAAFAAALTRPLRGAHVFNLRGEIATVETVMATIRALVPGADLAAAGAPVPIIPQIAAHDLAPTLGELPATLLAEGLRRTVEFYRAQGAAA